MAGNESHPENLKPDPVINISLPVRQSTRTFLMNLCHMLESNQCPVTPGDKQLRLKLLRSQMGIGFLHHISKFCMKSPTDKQSPGSDSLQDCVQWLRAKGTQNQGSPALG